MKAFLNGVWMVTVAAALVACGGEGDTTATPTAAPTATPAAGPEDLRFELPPAPTDGIQIVSPDMIIPAYTEKEFCYFTTYTGEDVGLNTVRGFQAEKFGHHVLLLATELTEEDQPDGTMIDCTTTAAQMMTEMRPLMMSNDTTKAGFDMVLPEGMAMSLKSGTRMIAQMHYVNTSERDVLVRDAMNLHFMPVDEVEIWAAPFSHVSLGFELEPSMAGKTSISCTWSGDFTILSFFGHMHERGTHMSVDMTGVDQEAGRIYEITEWDPIMRDSPPYVAFDEGEFQVKAGDVFTTECNWFNDTDHTITFPEEMCAFSGIIYPAKVTMICTD